MIIAGIYLVLVRMKTQGQGLNIDTHLCIAK